MTVTEIRPRGQSTVILVLDDGRELIADPLDLLPMNLAKGDELTDDEVEILVRRSGQLGALETAANMLSRKPQSAKEIERALQKKGFDEDSVAYAVEKLIGLGAIDDENYAKLIARHYGSRGWGERRISEEFHRRGIDRAVADKVADEIADPAETIDKLLIKRAGATPDEAQKRRVTAFLMRRGFQYDDIRAAWRRFGQEIEED